MSFTSLTRTLGERILADKGIAFDSVLYVDLGVESGGACPTCAYTEYPVTVWYVSQAGERRRHEKTFDYMSDIIKALEDIADGIYD